MNMACGRLSREAPPFRYSRHELGNGKVLSREDIAFWDGLTGTSSEIGFQKAPPIRLHDLGLVEVSVKQVSIMESIAVIRRTRKG